LEKIENLCSLAMPNGLFVSKRILTLASRRLVLCKPIRAYLRFAHATQKMPDSIDRRLTGMAGEFLVVGQLFKRHLQASITLGNAKAIDVLTYNPRTDTSYSVSVKTLRRRNCFPLNPTLVKDRHTYVFVVLNGPQESERFFIVSGVSILKDMPGFFGASLNYRQRAAVIFGPLKPYEDNWSLFEG
jgi:hypothetical protein